LVTTLEGAPLIEQAVPSGEVPVAPVVKVITLPAAPEAELKVTVREAACASGSIAGIVILGIAIFGIVIWMKGGVETSGIFI
jgi:type IV secretory pathway TrbD component